MIRSITAAALLVATIAAPHTATSQPLTIPGADGSDLVLCPTENFTVDLSLASDGAWDQPSPNPGFGVYDASKWAVVFKYTSVAIPAGVTVNFKNHPSGAPVVWLVAGDVQIDGTLDLNGTTDINRPCTDPKRRQGSTPGPGGFRGGHGQPCNAEGGGAGHGPGGGDRSGTGSNDNAQAGSSARPGWRASGIPHVGVVYGNGTLRRLVRGSGGGGSQAGGGTDAAGGGGGGAILVAASQTITITGLVTARGGPPKAMSGGGGGGSIRLLANSLAGDGLVYAHALGGSGSFTQARGGYGRIRIEANENSATWRTIPRAPLFPVPGAGTVELWPDINAATAKIVSVDGVLVPTDPHAQLELPNADVIVAGTTVDVVIETRNVDPTTIQVRLRRTGLAPAPALGAVESVNAIYQSGDVTQANWSASISIGEGFGTLIAVISDL